MSMRTDAALPCHFGADNELFGMYHHGGDAATCAVLLCPPLHQELIRSHRIYRQLADALAGDGLAALRFDYYGSGDSAGATEELDWQRCVEDTVAAAAELRKRSGCQRVLAFGARLGGSIAMAAAAEARFATLLLWDPVLDGVAHMARQDSLQEALRNDPLHYARPRSEQDAAGQWLGFPVGATWRRQLGDLRATAPQLPVCILDSLAPQAVRGWDRIPDADVLALPVPTIWGDINRLEHAILSPGMVRAAVGHLRKAS